MSPGLLRSLQKDVHAQHWHQCTGESVHGLTRARKKPNILEIRTIPTRPPLPAATMTTGAIADAYVRMPAEAERARTRARARPERNQCFSLSTEGEKERTGWWRETPLDLIFLVFPLTRAQLPVTPPPNTRLTALLYFRTPAVPLPLFCPPLHFSL